MVKTIIIGFILGFLIPFWLGPKEAIECIIGMVIAYGIFSIGYKLTTGNWSTPTPEEDPLITKALDANEVPQDESFNE